PEDGLLERDRLQPPRADGAKRAHAGREAAEPDPPEDVGQHLERVEGIDPERRAVALQRPAAADHAALLGEGLSSPFERIVGWRERIEQPHGAMLVCPPEEGEMAEEEVRRHA